MKTLSVAITALLLTQTFATAGIVTINMSTGLGLWTLRDSVANGGGLLTEGNAGIDGDGAQINLGYYSDWVTNGVFGGSDGTFIKLTGAGSTFGGADPRVLTTSVGDFVDNGPGPGQFSIDGLLISDTPANPLMPAAGTPLVMRIFNAATQGGSTYKMELANTSLWKWIAPAAVPPTISINTDDADLALQAVTGRAALSLSGGGNINANINLAPVPEPSSFAVGLLTAMSVLGSRVRRRK